MMNRDNHIKYIAIRKLFRLANGQRLDGPHSFRVSQSSRKTLAAHNSRCCLKKGLGSDHSW